MAFDATVGASTSNSYVDVSYMDDYTALRPNVTAWDALTETSHQAYLSFATTMLDAFFLFNGNKADDDQALHWPADDWDTSDDLDIDDDAIPVAVKKATCEQALYLLQANAIEDPSAIMKGLKSAKVGSIAVEFSAAMSPDKISPTVIAMLRLYGSPIAGARKYGLTSGPVNRA